MPYLKSLPADAGPPAIYKKFPHIYDHWAAMSEAMMNGPSPLGRPLRELILCYSAGVAGCTYVSLAHSEVAYASGIRRGLVEELLNDFEGSELDAPLRPLLAFVRKLAATPNEIGQSDVDAVFAAGWDEHALQDAVGICARAAFMHRLTHGMGFTPLSRDVAAERALKRLEKGYIRVHEDRK